MRKSLTALLVVIGVTALSGRAQAWWPQPNTAAFPLANPPGWYTNTYYFAWQYPWFAYYGYEASPYANWPVGGGFATYANYTGHPVMYRPWVNQGAAMPAPPPAAKDQEPADKKPKEEADDKKPDKLPDVATLSVHLPAGAKLYFNGTLADGSGSTRTFTTPALAEGTDYGYELVAEVTREGKTERAAGRVVVRAGQTTSITLAPGGLQVAGR